MPESRYLLERRQIKLGNRPKSGKKVPQKIAPKSAKMKVQDIATRKFNALFLSKPENKYCAIQIDENCTRIATTVNHLGRRGKGHIMNEEDCEASCAYCNVKIEGKDKWARDHGHLKSKFSPIDKI